MNKKISFSFDGKKYSGFEGDTLASALIRNDIFRSSLDDALRFDFNKIGWSFSSISSAYGAGIIASRLIGLDIELKKIVNGDPLASV